MFKKFTNASVTLVQRYLPDPFIFCIILTIIVFLGAMPATGQGPLDMVKHWGSGAWGLLAFSMQMVLVLVTGSAFATAPIISKGLQKIASIPKTPTQAIVITSVVSLITCWINWGFGLIVGALLAKEIAKKLPTVDYRLIIATAYSGFVVWHAGLSGSIPLAMATLDESLKKVTAGSVTEAVPITDTIFSMYNIIICLAILVIFPIVCAKMHPSPEDTVSIDPKLLEDDNIRSEVKPSTPAEKMEHSRLLSLIIGAIGLVYIFFFFAKNGFNLNLNIVNTIFLILGIILHGTPLNYVKAVEEAAKGAAGIILQFPFYAGIMGMMTGANADGVSLASVISNFFVNIATVRTFPLFTFWSAGIVNFFVPSGGGQWSVQGPIMLPAARELGVDPGLAAMGIAWGDAWTNLLQPFWALPALGLAKLGARDIMGYCVITLLVSGIIISAGLLLLV